MDDPRARVAAVLRALEARAAGLWRVRGELLEQAAFLPAPDLAPEVADAFSRATASVPLAEVGLGIVRAVLERTVAVSVADELPPDAGSGRWLRAFGATRSIAVPLLDPAGRAAAVLSVAVTGTHLTDDQVAELIRAS